MIPIRLSTNAQKEEVLKHFLSFERSDLYLRFGYMPNEYAITKYIEESWERPNDRWFGIYDVSGLMATLHIAKLDEDSCEFGFTVDKEQRNKGIGDTLFKRGILWAKARAYKHVYMQCLTENKAMQRIARKNEMHVVTLDYDEAEADLDVSYDPTAAVAEMVIDNIAIYDMLFVNQQKLILKMLGNNYDSESM